MAVRTSIQAQNVNYDLILKQTLSPVERQKAFAEFATEVVEDAKAHNARIIGSVPKHTISVDGRMGAPISSAQSVVFVEFEIVFDVLFWIHEMLQQHSPVRKGRYRDSHVLLADGVAVADPKSPPIAERYEFVNLQPYARKIERGLSPQRPDGVYQSVATLAKSTGRWGNIARIKFGYVTPLFGAIDTWANTPQADRWAKLKRRGSRKGQREWLRRQPAIIITL